MGVVYCLDFAMGAAGFCVKVLGMMYRTFLLAACATSLFAVSGLVAQDAQDAETPGTISAVAGDDGLGLTEADRAALDGINSYLNGLRTLRAEFVQTSYDEFSGEFAGAAGVMHLERPGLIRFAYEEPQQDPDLVVSDGAVVHVRNAGLNCVEEISLRATPFQVLLKEDVALERDARLVGLDVSDAGILLALQDIEGELDYVFTLEFAPMPSPSLRAWTVTDEFGQAVETRLLNAVPGETFERGMFRPSSGRDHGRRWPRDRDGFRDCAA